MTRRTRLLVHCLEERDVPSGVEVPPLFADPTLTDKVAGKGNAAPVISDFRAIVGPDGQVTFAGKVTDDTAVAGYVVRITGPGVDTSAVVLADGTFRVTTTVNGFTAITVSATTTDSGGLKSDPVYTTFTPNP